jgi:hypothetical protein
MMTEDKRQINPGLLVEASSLGVEMARRSEGEGVTGRGREGDWEDDGHQDKR